MMTWHYQLTKETFGEETRYAIREVYEFEDDIAWTADPIPVTGDTPEDVELVLNRMLSDLSRYDVLDITELERDTGTNE